MKLNLMQRHLFLDGYETPLAVAEDVEIMGRLLQEINTFMFHGTGAIQTIPVLDGKKPRNNGVSGVILASGGHFTCHTFSKRGVFFADAFPVYRQTRGEIKAQIISAFHPHHIQHRQNDYGNGFGRHVVLRLPERPAVFWTPMLDTIMTAINMTPLGFAMSDTDEHSFSLIRPIQESHISVHVKDGVAALDVFSCKDFSTDDLLKTLAAADLYPTEMISVTRGVKMIDKVL